MENLNVILGCLAFGIIAVYISTFFTPGKKSERRQNKNKKYCENKRNYKFIDSTDFSDLKLDNSQIFHPDGGYNQRFENVLQIEEIDFTLYLGDFFYQKDVPKSLYEKILQFLAGFTLRGAAIELNDPNVYKSYNWATNVPKPHNIGNDYRNYYYFQNFAIIVPKFDTSYPDFLIRVKKSGAENYKNPLKLPGHPIFNSRYILSTPAKDEIEKYLSNNRIHTIDNIIERNYIYETLNGKFIIRSEATFFDSIESMHKNALAMFTHFLCNQERNFASQYFPYNFYFASACKFRFAKVLALILFVYFCFNIYLFGNFQDVEDVLFMASMNQRYEKLVQNKEIYVPELMKGFTWKNKQQIRLVDTLVFDYKQIEDEMREYLFKPRFEAVKPQNIEAYATELVPRIKAKLGHIETYYPRTYEEAMASQYRCDNVLVVDTCALWLMVSRYYAQKGDFETAVLLPYAGIISAYESENKTADSMSVDGRVQHLDAINICAYQLLYLAVKYYPNPKLLKAIAKDMLKVAKHQQPCSTNLEFIKRFFIEALEKEKERAPEDALINKIEKYNLLDKFVKTYIDNYMPYADPPYGTVGKDLAWWIPYVMPIGSLDRINLITNLNHYFGLSGYQTRSNLIYLRRIVEEYLTKLEGIAIALLCKAYILEKGDLPNNIRELELWSEESFPVDRYSNAPYELRKDSDPILSSIGDDFLPNTKNDIKFW